MTKIRVLYIDDEVHNLNAFRAAFRRKYEIYTATGTLEARKILEQLEIPIIIADQRMPGTTGIGFFNSIKSAYPNSVRILITAYTEVESLIDAINKGQIYRFLKKPWDYFDLQNTIANAYDSYLTKKDLEKKIIELGKTNSELGRFITCLSNDLRKPILSALGIINLSKSDQSVEDPNGYIKIIEENLVHVDMAFQRMVEYYKNTNHHTINDKINFRVLIHECIEACKSQHVAVSFQVEVEQRQPFFGDFYRIGIILDNLISNAVKFRNPKSADPFVRLSVATDDEQVEIQIEDNGLGILDDHLDKIFNLFFHSKNIKNSGPGIGLFVVKEAIARLEGKILVSSRPGEGTTFTITIPNQNDEIRDAFYSNRR